MKKNRHCELFCYKAIHNNVNKNNAFSIIELLVVLSILGFILFLFYPSFRDVFEKNRSLSFTRELKSALRLARVSAVKFGEKVKVCGGDDFQDCQKGLWQKGLIIVTNSGKVIRKFPKIPDRDKTTYEGGLNDKEVVFLPTGFSEGKQGSFSYCPNGRSENALSVILNRAGRVRVSNKNAKGEKISCNF